MNVQDLTETFDYKGVENLGSPYTTVVGDRILIEYTGGDETNYVMVRASAEQQNDLKVTKQDVTMGNDSYRDRDQEACFIAYA